LTGLRTFSIETRSTVFADKLLFITHKFNKLFNKFRSEYTMGGTEILNTW